MIAHCHDRASSTICSLKHFRRPHLNHYRVSRRNVRKSSENARRQHLFAGILTLVAAGINLKHTPACGGRAGARQIQRIAVVCLDRPAQPAFRPLMNLITPCETSRFHASDCVSTATCLAVFCFTRPSTVNFAVDLQPLVVERPHAASLIDVARVYTPASSMSDLTSTHR